MYRRGAREDFQKLKDLGVELEGKIALAQYGGANRGVKIKNAEVSQAKRNKISLN
jgi:N-acetylated-alpha-linked acidic dipeptidase